MGQEEEISIENIEYLIEKYMAFLIKTVSSFTGRYISIENDEEFEIALLAFTEAIEKYQPEKGVFLAFAKLVIVSRLRIMWKKKRSTKRWCLWMSFMRQGRIFRQKRQRSRIII